MNEIHILSQEDKPQDMTREGVTQGLTTPAKYKTQAASGRKSGVMGERDLGSSEDSS